MQALRWALRLGAARLQRQIQSGEALIRRPCTCRRDWPPRLWDACCAAAELLSSCKQCPACQRWTLAPLWCSHCNGHFCHDCCGWPRRTYCPRCKGRRQRYASAYHCLAAVAASLDQVLSHPQLQVVRCMCGAWCLNRRLCH
jgi:hypothetical protein